MNITRAALEQRTVATVALVLIALGGIVLYGGMPRDEDPGFIIRTATDGLVRPLQTVIVDGVQLSESGPTLGIALDVVDS